MAIAKVCKFQKERLEISYDCGETFEPTSETRKIEGLEPVERNSTDCGFQLSIRTITSGYTCNGYDRYSQLVDVVSFNGVDWDVVEGSQRIGTIEEKWSPSCCQLREVTATTCDNRLRKVNAAIQEASLDGETWVQTGCYTIRELIDDFSIECFRAHNLRYYGIVPETEPAARFQQKSPFRYNSYGIMYGAYSVVETREKGFYMVSCDSDLIDFYDYGIDSTIPYMLSPIKVYMNCIPYARIHVQPKTAGNDVYGEDLLEYVYADTGATGPLKIGAYAHYGDETYNIDPCQTLHTVDLGNSTFSSVTISSRALSALTLPTANTVVHLDVYGGKLTTFDIPSGVTSLGGCGWSTSDINDTLESLTIPNTVQSLDFRSFRSHVALKDLSIGSGIRVIPFASFSYCTSLSSVTLSNSLNEIGYVCFSYNSGITSVGEVGSHSSVEIPNSLYSMNDTFLSCSGLTAVTIPSNVRFISSAFGNCENLESMTIKSIYPPYVDTYGFENLNNCRVYVPCESLYSYKSARGWKSIANQIYPIESSCVPTPYKDFKYKWDDGEDSYTVPCDDTYTISGSNGARGELVLGDCVHELGKGAFSGNTALTSVEISKTVDMIDLEAFSGCTALTSVTIPDNVVEFYGGWIFADCISLTSVTMPKAVYIIAERMFYNCSGLTSVTMPEYITYEMDSQKTLQRDMFYGCASLSHVTLPINLKTIGARVFAYCRSLTSVGTVGSGASVELPDSVESIGEHAFVWCTGLTTVTIPDKVTSIGGNAFHACKSLTSVTCLPTTPPSLNWGATFDDCDNLTAIYVPAESVDAYKSAWGNYTNLIQAIQT